MICVLYPEVMPESCLKYFTVYITEKFHKHK